MKVIVTSFPSLKDIVACIEEDTAAKVGIRLTKEQCRKLDFRPNGELPVDSVEVTLNVSFPNIAASTAFLRADGARITSAVNGLDNRRMDFKSDGRSRNVTSGSIWS